MIANKLETVDVQGALACLASSLISCIHAHRVTVEDGYVRGLTKLSKNVAAVPAASLG